MVSKIRVLGDAPLHGEATMYETGDLVPGTMVVAPLSAERSKLRNMPLVRDADVVSGLLHMHGATADYDREAGVLGITPGSINPSEDPVEMDRLTGSPCIPILFTGPLLHDSGETSIPDLGGYHIGPRPVNFHLGVLEDFGAHRIQETADIYLMAEKPLKTKPVHLPHPSVGTTGQTFLMAIMAQGITELANAAVEPEIVGLIVVLQRIGAIAFVGTDRIIRIERVGELCGYPHAALPDRTKASSWACAALATGSDVFIRGAEQQSIANFLDVLREIGEEFDVQNEGIRFWHPGDELHSVALRADAYPGLMIDWQQLLVIVLTQATDTSIVHETMYGKYFGFAEALNETGTSIQTYREYLKGLPC